MGLQYRLTTDVEGVEFLTVFVDGHAPLPASSESHSNFETLVSKARAKDESIVDDFDQETALKTVFARVSPRVVIRNGNVEFDGDVVDNALTKVIVRLHGEGHGYEAYVNFLENVSQNPEPHSREQLFRWLDKHDFPITEDGDILAYKGVRASGDGTYTSISSGRATVNDKEYTGQIPNAVGDVVEMPRSVVEHNPRVGCHVGLHAGTWDYANDFAQGAVMLVRINPRDVVSVPTDCADQKVRVCRYVVEKITEGKLDQALYEDDEDDLYDGDFEEDLDIDDTPDTPTSTTAFKVDTRLNHQKQQRDANGRFVKKV